MKTITVKLVNGKASLKLYGQEYEIVAEQPKKKVKKDEPKEA